MTVATDKTTLHDLKFTTAKELAHHMSDFLKKQEKVLICERTGLESMIVEAVEQRDGMPMVLGPDLRWKSLLRQVFFSRGTVLIGSPLFVLGLTKVARHTGTPLNVRTVVLVGTPCESWMIEGIQKGLDASIYVCSEPDSATEEDPVLASLRRDLLSWTSVLDYRAERTKLGLELEVISFIGERIPELPACGKRLVRRWEPDLDIPFAFQ